MSIWNEEKFEKINELNIEMNLKENKIDDF